MQQQGQHIKFASFAYPFSNYLCIIFMLAILVVMAFSPEMQIAVWMLPAWVVCLSIAYLLKKRQEKQIANSVVLD